MATKRYSWSANQVKTVLPGWCLSHILFPACACPSVVEGGNGGGRIGVGDEGSWVGEDRGHRRMSGRVGLGGGLGGERGLGEGLEGD